MVTKDEWNRMSMSEQAEAWETMSEAERRAVRPVSSLSAAERQRIIEEEELRKRIRGESGWHRFNRFAGNVLTLLILLVIIAVVLGLLL